MCQAVSKFNEKILQLHAKLPTGKIESKLYQEVGKDSGLAAPEDVLGYLNRVGHNDLDRDYAGIHKETQKDYYAATSALRINT